MNQSMLPSETIGVAANMQEADHRNAVGGTFASAFAGSSTELRPEATRRTGQYFLLSDRPIMRDLLASALSISGWTSSPSMVSEGPLRACSAVLVDANFGTNHGVLAEAISLACRLERPVVVVFAPESISEKGRWLELGATTVLTSGVSLADLSATLATLDRGESVLGITVRERLLGALRQERAEQIERHAVFQGLTRREAEVLTQLALGTSPEDVAKHSYVSLNTIRTQIRGVLAKLGVSSVVAAVALAYRTGWLEPDLAAPTNATQTERF